MLELLGKSGCFLSVLWQSCTRVSLFPCPGQLACGCRPSYLRPRRETLRCETLLYILAVCWGVLVLLSLCLSGLLSFRPHLLMASYRLKPPLSNRLLENTKRYHSLSQIHSTDAMQMQANARPVGTAATCSLTLGFELLCGCRQ